MQTTEQINSANELGRAVRNGRCGSDPRLVPEYIRSQTLCCKTWPRQQQWQAQADIVSFLFEAVADPLLAPCWRNWCWQCCCMPLHTLKCLSETSSENRHTKILEREMFALKQYFL